MRLLAPAFVAIGLMVSACGQTQTTRTITEESAAASSTTMAVATDPTSSDPGTSAPTTTITDDRTAENDLTVHPGDILPDEAKCVSDDYLDHSTRPVKFGDPEALQYSDSVSIPFVSDGKDDQELQKEIIEGNCGNPTELEMNLRAFQKLNPTPTFNIGRENPWIGECLMMVEDEDGSLRAAFLTKKENEDGIYVTEEYRQCAELLNTIFLAFQYKGEERAPVSVENWHVDKRTAGELPRAVLNPIQDNLPSFVYEYTIKAGCATLVIGYNTSDRRFELFKAPCAPPPCSSNCTPTTTPPTAPPCVTNCEEGKDHTLSPSTLPVVTCRSGQHANREGDCVDNVAATTTTTTAPVPVTPTPPPASTTPAGTTTTIDSGDGQGGQTV